MKRIGVPAVLCCLLLSACTVAPAAPAVPVPTAGTAATVTAQTTETTAATETDATAATTSASSAAATTAGETGTGSTARPASTRRPTSAPTEETPTTAGTAVAPGSAPTTETPTTGTAAPLPEIPADLLGVAPFGMGFIAVGTGGTVALLDPEGAVTPLPSPASSTLRGAAAEGETALIAGDGGALFTFDGSVFTPVPGAAEDLYCLARFGEVWYIGGAEGTLYAFDGKQLTPLPLPLLGDLTGLAANEERLIGVTSLGEWVSLLPDGTRQIGTANANRQGEEQIGFIGISEAGGTFWATARTAAGEAAVLTTLMGGVWTARPLTTLEGEPFDPAGLVLSGISARGEQAVAAANGGRLLVLPDCLACNKMICPGTGDYLAVCRGGGRIAAVGRAMAVAVTEDDAARQYRIAFETARRYLAEGAVLIDVRSPEEYAARHIAGSVNVPAAALAEELPVRYPDRGTALIFYCAKGFRSADAAKTAAGLGYARSYTAGGVDDGDWEYEAG